MVDKALFSSDSDEWLTPWALFKELHDEFNFTLDAAASEDNHLCPVYYTKETDGLLNSWIGHTVWCNPPYSNVGAWVERAAYCQKQGITTVMLIPARTCTKWFHKYIYRKRYTEIRFIKGRLRFSQLNEEGLPVKGKNSAPFPSMIVVFKGEHWRK
jgi:phage N-6-adenine-methyltransferase